jgi:phospholipase C
MSIKGYWWMFLAVACLGIVLLAAARHSWSAKLASGEAVPAGLEKVEHIVFLVKENRTFDN